MIFLFKRVSFLENTSSFSFSPLPYSGASNLGKIYANSSGEILTSSSSFGSSGGCTSLTFVFTFESIVFGSCAHMMKLAYREKGIAGNDVSGPGTRLDLADS